MRRNFNQYFLLSIGMLVLIPTIFAQNNLKLKYKRSSLYAGIEVGSKGVKMSLLEVADNLKRHNDYHVLMDTSVNTDFITFSPETSHETLLAFTGLYQTANNKYDISPDKIFTMVSSGVKVSADRAKKESWIQALIDSFRIKIGDPERKVEVIDAAGEARLSHLGIVPDSKRFTTFLIDIGSGNTKGGYFPEATTEHIKLFTLTWGTKSIANATNVRLDGDLSLENYYKQLQRVLTGNAKSEIIYAVNVSGAYKMSDNIAFSGGAGWAVATLMFPELIDVPVVPVTYQQVEEFYDRLYNNYSSLKSSRILRKIDDPDLNKKAIEKAVNTVNKVFDQRAMLAGTGLLLRIMRQFEGIYEKKQFYLVKNGQTGWISAYVNESIRK